ncbi:MAG: sporulation protein YunB [Cellulosilyticaceae bacterium]
MYRAKIYRKRKHYTPNYNKALNRKRLHNKMQGIFALCCIIAIVGLIYIQLDRQVMPTVMAMAQMQAKSMGTKAINDAITQTLTNSQTTMQDLISYDYNDAGELISWNVNSIVINNLCADIATKSNEELQNIGTTAFKVPLGNMTGSRIFANMGPALSVDVLPVGTVKVDYGNNIRSTGINQVNHTVWLDVEATVQAVVPLFSDQVAIKRRIVLIDKVIAGKVPPSYVQVPKDDILDVAPGDIQEP